MNRKKKEQRLEEELRHHLEAEARDRLQDGLSPADARSAARRDLGNVGLIQEAARDVWGWTSLERLAQDVRYGLRMVRRSPGLSALAVLSLAAGIGANATVYTIVRAVMSPPTGVPGADRVMNVQELAGGGSKLLSVNYLDWLALRDGNAVFSSACAWSEASVALSLKGDAEPAESILVTGGFFKTLGLNPAAGHFFTSSEEALPVAVVSHLFWRTHPESLGAVVRINGHAFTIIGVAPAGFTSPYAIFAPDLYVPLLQKQKLTPGSPFDHPGSSYLKMTGRLKPEIGRRQAEAALASLRLRQEEKEPLRLALTPLGQFPDDIGLGILGAAAFLFAISGSILLIACTNVGSLLLSRATARRGEMGVRLALGAGRARIVRQLVTESVLLFLPAAALGCALCFLASSALTRLQTPIHLPVRIDLAVDYRVLLFTLGLALAAGVLFGLAPASQSLRMAVLPALKETAISGSSRLRNAFLVCEFSLAFVLVMALGIFVEAAQRGGAVHPGRDPANLYLVDLDMSTLGYTAARRGEVYNRVFEQARVLPGVESAALAEIVPIGEEFARCGMQTLDAARTFDPDCNSISPGYLRTMGIPLLRGRDLTAADQGGAATPVIVNETMAKMHWPGSDPIGQRFRRQGPSGSVLEVVGVAANTRQHLSAGPNAFQVYMPAAETSPSRLILHLRLRGGAPSILTAVRDIARTTDPNVLVRDVSTLEQRIRFVMLPHRAAAALAGVFGALGILLAALGIYGVTAYAVSQRTREIGLRVALGAQPAQIWRTFRKESTRLIAWALAIAVALSFGIAQILRDLLYGVPPLNPLMVAAAAIAFAGVWLVGIFLPARRATAVDPSRALRWE